MIKTWLKLGEKIVNAKGVGVPEGEKAKLYKEHKVSNCPNWLNF